tara:strand:- start:30 stop:605 length:576 start_codon:yes stop_codon:yes gene_type:complete
MTIRNIDQAIKQAESISLSGQDLKDITDGKCNIFRYSDLMDKNTIDEVLGQFGAAILLYQTERDYGHYAAIFISHDNPNVLIFYDSLGLTIDKELKFSTFNSKNMGGVAQFHLTELIQKSKYKVISNTKKLQKGLFDNNTCGRFASMRIVFRKMTNKQFNFVLSSNKYYDADYAVSILTVPHDQLLMLIDQ